MPVLKICAALCQLCASLFCTTQTEQDSKQHMLALALQAERTYTLGNVYSLFHADTENLLLLIVANTSIYAGGEALGATRRTNELDIRTTSTAACSAGAWSTCLESVRAHLLRSLP